MAENQDKFEKYAVIYENLSMKCNFYNSAKHLGKNAMHTVVSERNGTFICELILERYKYLRNTEKRLKITIYGRKKVYGKKKFI